ncbi:MAG: MBL fold metallo-hydrolase [Anaerolinea sp.]|nr:MBL fold metallo-hydrolase [Anaerolinea sp.]
MQLPDSVTRVADGIFQVQIPLPFALKIVNCYLLEGGDGWTVLDTGLHRPEAEAVWNEAFAALGITPASLTQIVLTHVHPDHYGMAGWFQQWSGAPVYASKREAEGAVRIWVQGGERLPVIYEQMAQVGAPPDVADAVVGGIESTRQMTFPHPTHVEYIAYGAQMRMGGRDFTAIHAPGHSDGLLMFYDPVDKLILSGDHVLMKITPNIGLWTDTEPQPLARFMESLRGLRDMDVRLGLPGHKALITAWGERIDQLLHHHDERLEKCVEAVGMGSDGVTAYDVARVLFDFGRLSAHEMRFALVETLAHLDYLVARGMIEHAEGTAWRYHR